MKLINVLALLLFFTQSQAQNTFERLYYFSQASAVEELPDHSFIGCGDSIAIGVVFRVDSLGNQLGSFTPTVRGETMRIFDLKADRLNGGIAVAGYSADASNGDSTITYLLLDNQMQNIDSVFIPGEGVFAGGHSHTLLRTPSNDFFLGITDNQGAGSATSRAEKINYPSTRSWRADIGSHQSNNAIAIDSSGNLMMSSYNASAGSGASIKLFDSGGVLTHSFGITDTIMGGALVFNTVIAPAPNGNYMMGATLNPFATSYSMIYLCQLDSAFNLVWEKYIDWGFGTEIVAITPTSDGGIATLMNTSNGVTLYKTDINGDSAWIQFHNQIPDVNALRFQECADHGFIVAGEQGFTSNPHGYLLKTDSMGRVAPNADLTVMGNNPLCEGDAAVIATTPGNFYQWSTGDTTSSITVFSSGAYWVTVTDSQGLQTQSDTLYLIMLTPIQPSVTYANDTLSSSLASAYSWFVNDTAIIGAMDQFYVPVVNGYYQVYVTDLQGCQALSDSFLVTTVGIHENASAQLDATLSPNPTAGQSVLTMHKLRSGMLEISIVNSSSQKVMTLLQNSRNSSKDLQVAIDTSVFTPGVYYLRIRNEGEERVLKLIVN